jgi:hypothetical protein
MNINVDWILCLAWSLGHALLTALVGRTAVNSAVTYDEFRLDLARSTPHRWIGRCKSCSKALRVDGMLARGRVGNRDEVIVVAGTSAYRTADSGSNVTRVYVACCGGRVKLERVSDTAKLNRPRHECNAKCLASTGPSCECRCKGANHGASAASA